MSFDKARAKELLAQSWNHDLEVSESLTAALARIEELERALEESIAIGMEWAPEGEPMPSKYSTPRYPGPKSKKRLRKLRSLLAERKDQP